MRKMFTRLFSLALLLFVMGFVTELSAQCNVPPLTESNVDLVTNPADVCDSAYVTYRVLGYTDAKYAFNLDDDPSGWGGFTSDSTVAVKEGVAFRIMVQVDDTCYSDELYYTDVDLIEPVVIESPEVEHPQCYGDDGEVTIKFSGDHGPYTYYFVPEADWDEPADYPENTVGSAQIIAGTGTYFVAVQDVKGCVDLTNIAAWDTAVVNDAPPALVIDTIYGSDPECIAGDGTVTVVVSGGYGGEYSVTVGGVTETTVNDTAVIDVPEGTYTATAVDSNMCSVVSDSSVVLEDPAAITFDIALDDIACTDSTDGAIYVTNITGPADSSMYATIAFFGADTILATGTPVDDTIAFTDLKIGYYSIWVNNANDACDSVAYDNGGQNVISLQAPEAITYDVVVDTAGCYGDSSTINIENVSGGNAPYEYQLEDGSDNVLVAWSSASSWNVVGGTYVVAVKDDESCVIYGDAPVVLTDPTDVSIVSVDTVSPTCPGGNDGVISISATGGSGEFEYAIRDITSSADLSWYENHIFAVSAAEYNVYARDLSCSAVVASQTVMIDTLDENIIEIDEMDTFITCNGASDAYVDIDVDTWADQTGSDNRTISIFMTTDESEVWVSGDSTTTGYYDDLGPGTYYFWAKDNLGCMSKNSISVKVTEEDALDVIGSATGDASCYGSNDGTLTIKLTGGTEPFEYGHANTWQAAMNLPDAAFTAWPVGADSVDINVGKGTYYVVVKDDCDKKVARGPFNVDGLDMVTISDTAKSVTDIVCYGDTSGVIEVFPAEGGSEDFTYTLQVWDGTWVDVAGYVDVTETVFVNLPAGTFKVVVTDALCAGAETGEIVVDGPESGLMYAGSYSSDITCFNASDGAIGFAVSGGTMPYEYKIGTNSWLPFPDETYGPGSASQEVLITEPGTYTVWVRDTFGCMLEDPFVYTINEPNEILVDVDTTHNTNSCDAPNGELKITVTGGRPGVSYIVQVNDSILPGSVDSAVAVSYSGLGSGDYAITAVEISWYSCEGTASATITSPESLDFDAVIMDSVHCKGSDDGIIVVSNISGGQDPYYTTISGPVSGTKDSTATEITFSDLVAGLYEVTVTDMNGCTKVKPLTISEPDSIILATTWISDITCSADGSFSVQAEGGSGAFKYYAELSKLPEHILVPDPMTSGEWQTDSIFEVDQYGTYIVWAYDTINGCLMGGEDLNGTPINEWRVKIAAPNTIITFDADSTGSPLCNGDMNDSIIVSNIVVTIDGVVQVDPEVTVMINEEETDTLTGIGAGVYYVTVTHDASGCSTLDSVVIDETPVLEVVVDIADGQFSCPGVTEGFIQATANGGTPGLGFFLPLKEKSTSGTVNYNPYYQFQLWQDGVLKTDYVNYDDFLVNTGHDYFIVVKDANGCTDTSNVLSIDPVDSLKIEAIEDVTCSGDTAASVNVIITGEEGRKFKVVWRQYEEESDPHFGETEWTTETEILLDQTFKFDNESDEDQHYEIYVVDSMGCTSDKDSVTFDQVITDELNVTAVAGEVDGCGTDVTITASGGVAPYTIMVDDEVVTDETVTLSGGTHIIKVIDLHSCSDTTSVTLDYPLARVDSVWTYTDETVDYTDAEAGLDTALDAGTHVFVYEVDETCENELTVVVSEKDRAQPVVESVSPNDSIDDNHPTFVIVFEEPVTWNDSVAGNLTVTAKDSTEASLVLAITKDMLSDDGTTITVDYTYPDDGQLLAFTTYVVEVDSGIVWGDGLVWDGTVEGGWEFTTGDWATSVTPGFETVDFKVYPNPFNNFIRVDNYDKLDRVIVSNIAGQRVLDIEYPSYEIRTGNLTTGVYVVTLISNDEIVKSERIIKR